MNIGAVIFDLDDTLYRERRYALSGFAAVSRALQGRHGIDAASSFRTLVLAARRGRRASAFQELCERFGLDDDEVPRLVQLMRMHTPRLRLTRATREVLAAVRRSQPTAILTNGRPVVQVRKIAALAIERLVDSVIYASEHGTGVGKPEAAPFLAVCARLRVHPHECVFVGNDPARDIAGARAVGMRTIRVGSDAPPLLRPDADVVVDGIAEVPVALGVLAALKKGVRSAA